jgi:hypothetical protein
MTELHLDGVVVADHRPVVLGTADSVELGEDGQRGRVGLVDHLEAEVQGLDVVVAASAGHAWQRLTEGPAVELEVAGALGPQEPLRDLHHLDAMDERAAVGP